MEGIDHQVNSPLALELKLELQKVRKSKTVSDGLLRAMDFSKIIKRNTGLNIDIKLTENVGAYVFIPDINNKNPMLDGVQRTWFKNKDSKKLLKHKNFIDGTVDLSTGKVTGDYGKTKTKIHLGEALLRPGLFTIYEVTAILLHEIGHVFVYMEMLGRVTRTNYLMEEGSRRLMGTTTKEQRIVILEEISDAYNADLPDIEKYAEQTRGKDSYRATILSLAVKDSRSQLGANVYDTRSYEQLADQYVTRHGYGRQLVIAVDKIQKLYGDNAYNSPAFNTIMNVIKFLSFLALTVVYVGVPLILMVLLADPLSLTYDHPKERASKIRREIINALKTAKLSKAEKTSRLEDLEAIKLIESDMSETPGVTEWIWQNLMPSGRKQHKDNEMQLSLERMLNNDLYTVKSTIETRT